MKVTIRPSHDREEYDAFVLFERGAMTEQIWKDNGPMLEATGMRFLDATGRPWGYCLGSGAGGGGDYRNFDKQFRRMTDQDAKSTPVKLVIEVFTEALPVPIPYDLRDLPLP